MENKEYKNKISDILTPYANEMDDTRLGEYLTLSIGRVLLKNTDNLQTISKNELRHITDWLKAAIINNETWISNLDTDQRPKKLMKFNSIEGIIQEVDKAMKITNQKLANIKLIEGDEKIFARLQDGYYITKMLTPAALDRESSYMQHCIGQGAYDHMLNNDRRHFLSLRDPAGKPHVTIEIENNIILQLQGKQNKPPIKKYVDILIPFIKKKAYFLEDVSTSLGYLIGYVKDARKNQPLEWYDLNDLPDNLTIPYNVYIRNTNDIKKLPNNLTIDGSLNLLEANITEIGSNLNVTQSLNIFDSRETIHFSNGMKIGQILNIQSSTIKNIPEDIKIAGSLLLFQTNVEIMPSQLEVGKCLDIIECNIKELPAKLTIKNDFILSKCPYIQKLPENLKLENLYINNAEGIENLPTGLTINGTLDIRKTKITELPKDIKLNYLFISTNQIENFPDEIDDDIIVYLNDHAGEKMTLKDIKERNHNLTYK